MTLVNIFDFYVFEPHDRGVIYAHFDPAHFIYTMFVIWHISKLFLLIPTKQSTCHLQQPPLFLHSLGRACEGTTIAKMYKDHDVEGN